MLGRLITPIRARFELSTGNRQEQNIQEEVGNGYGHGHGDENAAAESFARDVLVELMRSSVEALKGAESLEAKILVMGEMHRIMLEDACTKDVFRELDGYLLVVNVLAILHAYLEIHDKEENGEQSSEVTETEEGERLAFMLLAESLNDHFHNQYYFEKHVGYEALYQALTLLVKDARTVDRTFGFLLSVAINNFALSSLFTSIRSCDNIENNINQFKVFFGTIHFPHFILLMVKLLSLLSDDDNKLPHALFIILEQLLAVSHRNKVLLSRMPLFEPLVERFLGENEADTANRSTIQKILRKLLDIGSSTDDAFLLFKRVVNGDNTLNADVLEVLRSSTKARWPQHFSLENASSLELVTNSVKGGLPTNGLTFMMWLWVEKFHLAGTRVLFKISGKGRPMIQLSVRLDGVLELSTAGFSEVAVMDHAKISLGRWTHVTVTHHPHRVSNPTIRIFLDGVLVETRNWAYPKPNGSAKLKYSLGDDDDTQQGCLSWCIASAYLISQPLSDDLPRLVQHLGPRYTGNFQTKDLVRFLTYDAATSLNVLISSRTINRMQSAGNAALATITSTAASSANLGLSPLMRAVRDGLGVPEESLVFAVGPNGHVFKPNDGTADYDDTGLPESYILNGVGSGKFKINGDFVVSAQQTLDLIIWKIGGASVPLRLVELASTPHELSRAIGIFSDSARFSWQMSEDMEQLRAYDILASILRLKAQLINVTSFETLFEFLGLNFRTPDNSVVVNTLAYRSLALDFDIWARARQEIQQLHLDHFELLLVNSKYKNFNAKQRLTKFGIVRKLLFVLQTEWYSHDLTDQLIKTLKVVAQACFFSADDTIKPLVSYLAANLHEAPNSASSPRSIMSRADNLYNREKAETVLGQLASILFSPSHLAKFSSSLPSTRICLLLLGERPSPTIARHILTIIALSLKASASFSRKFELLSGWTALKLTLPSAWDKTVQSVAFDILLGRLGETETQRDLRSTTVICPYILPAILSALHLGLVVTAQDDFDENTLNSEDFVEALLEDLMDLQSSSPSFRQSFKSQQITALVIGAYASYVSNGPEVQLNKRNYVRVLEKLNHFVLSLTMDKHVNSTQKQEMMEIFQTAESFLNDKDDSPHAAPTNMSHMKKPSSIHTPFNNIHALSERGYQKTMSKLRDWRKNIVISERKRLRRAAIDLREVRRHAEHNNDWRNGLFSDQGIWSNESALREWILDDTEGPCRVKKKLEPKFETTTAVTTGQDGTRSVLEPDADVLSFVHIEVPPWAETYDIPGPDEEQHWLDEAAEDKHRRIRHELLSGDVIDAVCTVTRIVGVDSSPGLLILGRNNLYMIDGLVENEEGEVIDAHDAPRDLFFVPGSLLELDGKQQALHWSYQSLTTFSKKSCLFRDVALELYFKDCRSLLISFRTKKKRQEIVDRLTNSVNVSRPAEPKSPLVLRTPLLGKASKMLTSFRDEVFTAQRRWQAREISNFTYLSILNQCSGRTPGDATQYPVFPWVLSDYSSEELDFNSPDAFRDLKWPMGAMTEARRVAAQQRYLNLQSIGETPFHHGTHFSSSMIVCHFLIRLEPFTHMFKTLQGGDWDLPDRLFSDIGRAYFSASEDLRGDVRELIPEFFTCPEFLQNASNLDFGVLTSTGERIHDVKLPPWAKQDPLLFVVRHRAALESDFVSEHLPEWIDLIWGVKQKDQDSCNVFHPLSYEGAIDLDSIKDDLEREATVGIIHNFGQTPKRLFDSPHPARIMNGTTSLPLGTQFGVEEDPQLLVQSARPVSEISSRVASLYVDSIAERVLPCQNNLMIVPQFSHEQIGWGYTDQSLRLIIDRKVVQVAEAISCSCVAFVDSESFVTGCSDNMLRVWQLSRTDGVARAGVTFMLRTHTAPVLCVAVCRSWSLIVSGSADGTAVIWDLNRGTYVRSISHIEKSSTDSCAVYVVAINDSTGYIATCSEATLCIHTVNAHEIVRLDLRSVHPNAGRVTSLAFHEREYSRLGVLATGMSNGTILLRSWTAKDTPPGEKAQWKFVTLRTLQCRDGIDGRVPNVTTLQFVGESLFHGEESGKVFVWELPD